MTNYTIHRTSVVFGRETYGAKNLAASKTVLKPLEVVLAEFLKFGVYGYTFVIQQDDDE